MLYRLYSALRAAPSFGAFLRGIFRRQKRFAYVPSEIHPIGEDILENGGALARRDVRRESEALIAESLFPLSLPEERRMMNQAMSDLERRLLEYQEFTRCLTIRLLMVKQLPPQSAYENLTSIQNRVDELRDQNRRFSSEIATVIGLINGATRDATVNEIIGAPRFIELSFVTNDPRSPMMYSVNRKIYPPIMCINKSYKKDLIKVKAMIL